MGTKLTSIERLLRVNTSGHVSNMNLKKRINAVKIRILACSEATTRKSDLQSLGQWQWRGNILHEQWTLFLRTVYEGTDE